MKKTDTYKTNVFFVKDRHGVTAVFPDLPADNCGNCTCYAHIGQHSACSKSWYVEQESAMPYEYEYLWKELEVLGYNLKLIERR